MYIKIWKVKIISEISTFWTLPASCFDFQYVFHFCFLYSDYNTNKLRHVFHKSHKFCPGYLMHFNFCFLSLLLDFCVLRTDDLSNSFLFSPSPSLMQCTRKTLNTYWQNVCIKKISKYVVKFSANLKKKSLLWLDVWYCSIL